MYLTYLSFISRSIYANWNKNTFLLLLISGLKIRGHEKTEGEKSFGQSHRLQIMEHEVWMMAHAQFWEMNRT